MLRDFFIYGVGAAASRLAAVFLVPIYTRVLSQAHYGQLEVLLALHTLAVLVVGLQAESAVLRDFYAAREEGHLPQLSWAALAIAGLGTVVAMPVVIAAVSFGWLDAELTTYLPALLLLTILAQLLGIQLILLRFSARPLLFGVISFCDVAISALASVALIVGAGWGIWGALAGMILGKAICLVAAWSGTFGWPAMPRPPAALLRRMLLYALPTMPSVLFNWVQTNATRVVLALFLPFGAIAIVSVGLRVAALFGFLVYSFRLAWEPWAFRVLDSADREPQAYNRVLQLYCIAMLALAGFATVAAPMLVALFAPLQYGTAATLVGYFVMGQFWNGIATITSIGVHGARVTSRLTWIFGAGALVNLAVTVWLVPVFGLTAAAWALLAGSIVTGWAAAWSSERHFATGFSYRLLAAATVGSVIIATLGNWVFAQPEGLARGVIEAMALLGLAVACVCGVLLVAGFDRDGRKSILAAARQARAAVNALGKGGGVGR